jgi:hypothetical protein
VAESSPGNKLLKISEQLEAAPEVEREAAEVELSPLQTATEAEEVLKQLGAAPKVEAEERLFDSDEEAEISDRGCYRIMIIINIIAVSPIRHIDFWSFHHNSRSCESGREALGAAGGSSRGGGSRRG